MAIENTISMEELKTIIHGLRMATLSFVEEKALDEIKAMIKALPLPEEMDKLLLVPTAIKNLQIDVGNIMRLIELYGKRDIEFKTRYKSRTGLPPRYKVLDWKEQKMQEFNKAASVKEVVKISSELDNKGHGELSGRINKFASKMVKDEFDEAEFDKIAAVIKESGLEKEAQMWQQMKGFMGGALNKAKEIGKDIWQSGKAGGLESQFNAIYKQLEDFQKKVDAFSGRLANNPTLQQKMQALSQSIELSGSQLNNAANAVKTESVQPSQTAQAPRPQGNQITQPAAPTNEQPIAEVPMETAPGTSQPQTTSKFQEGSKVKYNNREYFVLGTDPHGNVQLGKEPKKSIMTIDPAKLLQQNPVTASSFNLKMYKSAGRK